VAGAVAQRIVPLLERRGLADGAGPRAEDALAQEEPLLAEIAAASVAGRVATGRRAGGRVLRVGDRIDAEDLLARVGERCAILAAERLSRTADGRLLHRLKHRWGDGTTHVVFRRRRPPTR
jgi:hypothetical protein